MKNLVAGGIIGGQDVEDIGVGQVWRKVHHGGGGVLADMTSPGLPGDATDVSRGKVPGSTCHCCEQAATTYTIMVLPRAAEPH